MKLLLAQFFITISGLYNAWQAGHCYDAGDMPAMAVRIAIAYFLLRMKL